MKKLQLVFKTDGGAHRSLNLRYFRDDLTPAEVKAAMEQMAAAKLFSKEGSEIYHEPVSAKYVTTTEDVIFEDKEITNK